MLRSLLCLEKMHMLQLFPANKLIYNMVYESNIQKYKCKEIQWHEMHLAVLKTGLSVWNEQGGFEFRLG